VTVVVGLLGAENKAKAVTGVENVSNTLLAVPVHPPEPQEPVPPTKVKVTVVGVKTGLGVQPIGDAQVVSVNGNNILCDA